MALTGKLEAETEIKSPADKFFEIIAGKAHQVPNMCPKRVQNVEVHDGDWKTHGSVKHWTYVVDGKVETLKEKIELDEENKVVTMVILEGDPLKHYKSYKLTIKASPKGEGSLVKWTIEYEKLNEDTPDPHQYLDFLINATRDIDASLLKA